MRGNTMNIKKIFLTVLFFSTLTTHSKMGLELSFPLSALIFLAPPGDLAARKAAMKRAGGFGRSGGMTAANALPQTYGYYTSSTSFDFCLQAGVNIQYGFLEKNGPYSNSVFYFSDIMRTQLRTHYKPYSASPQSAYDRGQAHSSPYQGNIAEVLGSFLDPDFFNKISIKINLNRDFGIGQLLPSQAYPTIQIMKYYGFANATGITISERSFKSINGEPLNYYFAETGVDVFLPLHMVTPGDSLEKPDPDYLNYGIFSGNYNVPKANSILPWSHKYLPKDLPSEIVKTEDF